MTINLPSAEAVAAIVAALVAILAVVWPGHPITTNTETAIVAGAMAVLGLFIHGKTTIAAAQAKAPTSSGS